MLNRIASKYPRSNAIVKHGSVPGFLYLLIFCALTFPLIGRFFTHFFADRLDGMQNAWNLWWVYQAFHRHDLYPSIWQTSLLHWPSGTTLLGHDLNPFNGFLAVFLLRFLPLTAAYNTIVLFSFVLSGLAAYWLAYVLTKSYWPSLLAGFLYTFSSYHFMHLMAGHLDMVSFEWIPMFALCWIMLLRKPSIMLGIASALVLWLALLCSYYYFFDCVLLGLLILVWSVARARSIRFVWERQRRMGLLVFGISALVLTVPLVGRLLLLNATDPLTGGHPAASYSLDLLALFIPGMSWSFRDWTEAYSSRLAGSVKEGNVYLPLSTYVLLGYVWLKSRRLDPTTREQVSLWTVSLIFFFLLALGPVLHVNGLPVWDKAMPYVLLTKTLPLVGISGVPVRMVAVVVLAASVLSAIGFREISRNHRRNMFAIAALLCVLLFQTLPAPVPTTSSAVPAYVAALRDLPNEGGLLNLLPVNRGLQLYYQTIHGKPMAFGYVSRTPTSVAAQDQALMKAIAEGDYASLSRAYRIRYLITSGDPPSGRAGQGVKLELIYDKQGTRIYRLRCTCGG